LPQQQQQQQQQPQGNQNQQQPQGNQNQQQPQQQQQQPQGNRNQQQTQQSQEPQQSQTLIQYIASHKIEFEDVRARLLQGNLTDEDLVRFIITRLGCDQLLKKNSVGNPCNNPNSSRMYATLVEFITKPFSPESESDIKQLIIKLCVNDCANWDSFYHIFKAMGLYELNTPSRFQIVNKFIDLFGGYLVLGAHFTVNIKNDISIEWFDNIGTLQNDSVERPPKIHWTKLDHRIWKWFGYSNSYSDHDKLTQTEINDALTKWFPHKFDYRFEQGPIATLQISLISKISPEGMEMGGGKRRTKRNAKCNAKCNANVTRNKCRRSQRNKITRRSNPRKTNKTTRRK